MTPQFQTIKHNPMMGTYGDCYRSAIASLLDLPPDEVPHVMDGGRNSYARMQEWLSGRGLWLFDLPMRADSVKQALAKIGTANPGCYWLLLGKSKAGTGHCVVCLGSDIVHDPNPKKTGIVGPLDAGDIYYAQLIIPLSMTSAPKD